MPTEPARLTVDAAAPAARIVYVDRFGNAMTGIPADTLAPDARLVVGDTGVAGARTFGAVQAGTAFWYRNSLDLAELAVNQGSAAADLRLTLNMQVRIAQNR